MSDFPCLRTVGLSGILVSFADVMTGPANRAALAFRAVVAVELLATVLLSLGTFALLFSLLGLVSPQAARAIALTGATVFVAIWSTFLIVGNHFSYWFCHEGAQNTHYQMTLWGIATMVLLAVG